MNNDLFKFDLNGKIILKPKQTASDAIKLQSALSILREFVRDVTAAGRLSTKEDWPDLYITFSKAKKLLTEINSSK